MQNASEMGFVKVAALSPKVTVANPVKNKASALDAITKAAEAGAQIIVLPELHLSAYTCADLSPFIPRDSRTREERCQEIFSIQAAGLARRMAHTGLKRAVIGISGGLDSTLALLVASETMKILNLPAENILCVTMPGFGTTDRTYRNALELIASLGAELREIDIRPACLQHMKDIGHDPEIHDVTYENTQARERTQILMDMANKEGGLLVGTGDLSELAMGWCTYNGDHMSMYGVNASVPKTLVRYLVDYVASRSDARTAAVLREVLDTPVSPELLPPDETARSLKKRRITSARMSCMISSFIIFCDLAAKGESWHFWRNGLLAASIPPRRWTNGWSCS